VALSCFVALTQSEACFAGSVPVTIPVIPHYATLPQSLLEELELTVQISKSQQHLNTYAASATQ
jgi:hypothetical protein